jgi:hypothetical protein
VASLRSSCFGHFPARDVPLVSVSQLASARSTTPDTSASEPDQLHRLMERLRWENVDFERGMLLLPDSKTGRKAIVLNAPVLGVLANLPRFGAYVIAGRRRPPS